ncbi:hypothetical protein ACS0TY_014694 [Phlomoides rotata]
MATVLLLLLFGAMAFSAPSITDTHEYGITPLSQHEEIKFLPWLRKKPPPAPRKPPAAPNKPPRVPHKPQPAGKAPPRARRSWWKPRKKSPPSPRNI